MVSEKSKIMTADFKKALSAAIKDMAKTDEGRKSLPFIHMMAMLIQQKLTLKQPLKWQIQ